MKDTIIKNTGNSRFLRSSVAENITFSEFIALLRAGQLPIDLAGINENGIDVLGMGLKKETLLDDEAETIIWGAVGDHTPADALKKIIANFAAYLEAKVVTGFYTGDGSTNRTISLDFTPKAVLLHSGDLQGQSSSQVNQLCGSWDRYSALAVTGRPQKYEGSNMLACVEGGFKVYFTGNQTTNRKNVYYHYIAIA